MVVTIKEHRYDVDFDDVRVIAAADDGKRAIVEAHASLPPVTDASYGKCLIDFLDVVKAAVDGVVGDGVSAECFGDAYNWRDILSSFRYAAPPAPAPAPPARRRPAPRLPSWYIVRPPASPPARQVAASLCAWNDLSADGCAAAYR